MSFGQTIRRRREALGLTIEQLAERSGLSPNYVGSVENGKRDPSLSTILGLAKGFRVSAADLIGGAHDLTAEGIEAAHLFEACPTDVQDAIVALLRAAARKRR